MDRRSLPSDATKSSRIRYQLALELAQACAPELGLEIALTGSVSRSLADDDSDIEWVAWVETLPSAEERLAWMREVGATDIIPDQGHPAGVCVQLGLVPLSRRLVRGWLADDRGV